MTEQPALSTTQAAENEEKVYLDPLTGEKLSKSYFVSSKISLKCTCREFKRRQKQALKEEEKKARLLE
jgi:hypothetical protein